MQLETVCYEIHCTAPKAVVYIHSGGYAIGCALAKRLRLPLVKLDVRYPLSRIMAKYPSFSPILWLFKECVYRLTQPRPKAPPLPLPFQKDTRPIILSDDRVSSFRTMEQSLNILKAQGINRGDIIIVTTRCSPKSKHLVDYIVDLK